MLTSETVRAATAARSQIAGQVMIFYSWTALSQDDREAPGTRSPGSAVAMGITDDCGQAMAAGEEILGSGCAVLVVIEAVRPAMVARTLAPCYVGTGAGWLGRRTPAGPVAWSRFFRPAEPDGSLLAGWEHETPDLH